MESPWRAVKASFDPKAKKILIELRNGITVGLPKSELPEISRANSVQLRAIELSPAGDALMWENLDVHISIDGLLHDVFVQRLRA